MLLLQQMSSSNWL